MSKKQFEYLTPGQVIKATALTMTWPFPTIKEFPQGSHKKAGYLKGRTDKWKGVLYRMDWTPHERFMIDTATFEYLEDRYFLAHNAFYTFQYAVCLFRQKPYSYLELHGIDPESEEGKAHLALWMKHRLEGE